MIRFRATVNPRNVHPAVWLAIGIAYNIRYDLPHAPPDMWVTSMNDGIHGTDSLHYIRNSPDKTYCRAADIRTFDLVIDTRTEFAARARLTLTPLGYDVVLHLGTRGVPVGVAGESNVAEHLHIEFQPHTPADAAWFPDLQVA